MYKTIFSACATTLIALAATTTLGAENVTKNLDLSSFKGIEASTSCEIRLEESTGPSFHAVKNFRTTLKCM